MGGQPTLWDWITFGLGMLLLAYALYLFVVDRVPGLAGGRQASRGRSGPAWLERLGQAGDLCIDYLYLPIWRAIRGLWRALWGAPPPAAAAPVVSIDVPLPASYVTHGAAPADDDPPPFSAFERAERPAFVQAVQPAIVDLSPEDLARVDGAARALAAGLSGEAALIELFFDGVKRGGSKRYLSIRDAVRAQAERYGWKGSEIAPPAPAPRVTPVAGRELPEGAEFRRTP